LVVYKSNGKYYLEKENNDIEKIIKIEDNFIRKENFIIEFEKKKKSKFLKKSINFKLFG